MCSDDFRLQPDTDLGGHHHWSAGDNLRYNLEEQLGVDGSALLSAGPTSLSPDHPASQLMAPCTHPCHYDFDSTKFFRIGLMPMALKVDGGTKIEFHDVC